MEDLLFSIPGKDEIISYFRESYGHLLEKEGLQYVSYRGTRWYRIVDDMVLLSVNLLPTHYNYQVYYGYQPLFFPLYFPTTKPKYINQKWTLFDADLDFCYQYHPTSMINVTPLYSEDSRRADIDYWSGVFEKTVFPVFRYIKDASTAYEKYKERRREMASFYMNEFDGRLLLESIFLDKTSTIKYICNQVLKRQLEKDPNATVWMDYTWLTAKDDSRAIRVSDLVADIEGSREMLWARINNTIEQSRKTLHKIGLL